MVVLFKYVDYVLSKAARVQYITMKCIFSFLFEESRGLVVSKVFQHHPEDCLKCFCYRADFLVQTLSLEFHTFAP